MRTIQRDTKLNRHGLPLLDTPYVKRPVAVEDAERETKLRATEQHWDEFIKQQTTRRSPVRSLRRF